MPIKIVNWNVNSIRTRLKHVLNFIDTQKPTVLCLQETKVTNENFPYMEFEERGLHVYHHGQKSYNGVALISTQPLDNIVTGFAGEDIEGQCRLLAGTLNGMRIITAYMPQGESVDSPKFQNKENHYKALIRYVAAELNTYEQLVIGGDFNIAPHASDVDDPQKRRGKCMFTDLEHSWLTQLEKLGLHDAMREITEEAGHFSWWDYRSGAWENGRGMRIDLMYISSALQDKLEAHTLFKEERGREKPSDHAPIMISISD